MTGFVSGLAPSGAFFLHFVVDFVFLLFILSLRCLTVITLGVVMVINAAEKSLLLTALETEQARLKRSINAEKSQAIREIHSKTLGDVTALHGRVYNEVVK